MRSISRLGAQAFLVLALSTAALANDLSGSWKVDGTDKTGRYRGTATVTKDASGAITGNLTFDYVRWDWSSFSYKPTGRKGGAKLEGRLTGLTFRGTRTTLAGLAGGVLNSTGQTFNVTYGVSRSDQPNEHGSSLRSFGGRYDGQSGRESLTGHNPGSTPTPPTPPTPVGGSQITLGAKLLAVPGTPEAGRQPLVVVVGVASPTAGDAELTLSGPGRLLRDGAALSGAVRLGAGTHRLQVEGTGDGLVTVTLKRGSTELARATSQSNVERLYALLGGYQGAEVDYLEGDMKKQIDNIVPHLAGYARVEDGTSYDQSKIDRALDDPANHKKVLIDWCVTREDLIRYLKRGTLRGITWGSHGYMEPWPGCPDSELDMFESRVWSSTAGAPQTGDAKNFVREWNEHLVKSARQHGKLDFVLMHSCCTGGIGSYRDEVWNYINATTKSRALAVLGDPLPTYDRLRYTSFKAMQPSVNYLKTYDGPSYFGYHDVSWSAIRGSLQPSR
jgi:hypothetical protein